MSVENVLKRDRLCRALTGLTPQEFRDLLSVFAVALAQATKEKYLADSSRKRKPGAGRKPFVKTVEEKLLFILLYHKVYPTFSVLGFIYNRDGGNVWHAYDHLAPVLESALGKKLALPKRQIRSVEEFFEAFPEAKEVFLDGTERPIQRPKNAERQTANYSGKKKRHTRKNLILSTRKRRVGYLSPTAEGKEHDFSIVKRTRLPDHIPKKKVRIRADSGFQGLLKEFPGHAVSIPRKKPKGRQLCKTFKEQNLRKSRIRILVEHAIGGVKRFRIVADVFRNKQENVDDRAMLITCGLWNYHLDSTSC